MLTIAFYIAITVEAMTAALAAGRRNMDWFGVCLIACVTALGGGTMRDILLDHYPLVWVKNPYVLLLVCGAALLTIPLARLVDRLKWPFLLLDFGGDRGISKVFSAGTQCCMQYRAMLGIIDGFSGEHGVDFFTHLAGFRQFKQVIEALLVDVVFGIVQEQVATFCGESTEAFCIVSE